MPTDENPVVIHEGDCLDILRAMPDGFPLQHIITDPPYGVSLECHAPGHIINGVVGRRHRDPSILGDGDTESAESVFRWADRRNLPLVAFGSPYQPYPGKWRNVLVWDKGGAVGGGGDTRTCWKRTFEMIYTRRNRPLNEGRDGAVLYYPVGTGGDFEHHPCQKPIPLMRYLIRQLTDPGDVILDPFAGSGTTAVAALREGRKCILIEKDPRYAALCRERVATAMGAGSLLAGL